MKNTQGRNEERFRRQNSRHFLTADVLVQDSSRRRSHNLRHVSGQEFSRAHPHVVPLIPILVLGRTNLRLQAAHSSPNACPFRQTFLNEFPATVEMLGATFHLQGLAPGSLWTSILTKLGLVQSHFPFCVTRFFWCTTDS